MIAISTSTSSSTTTTTSTTSATNSTPPPTSRTPYRSPNKTGNGNMGNKRGKKNRQRNRTTKTSQQNFVAEAGPGCVICRIDDPNCPILGWENDLNDEEFEGQQVPDIAIDPEEKTLSLCNIERITKVAYVTVYENQCWGRNAFKFVQGQTTDNKGNCHSCQTFIILCPPLTFAHLCHVEIDDMLLVKVESDVQEWSQHPNPMDSHPQVMGFPLLGGPFLCTQGEGGQLTHFFKGNLHAIDFRCDVGTPLLAVADGIVIEACASNTLTGIAVSNLFTWNSIMIQLDEVTLGGLLFVEYVHVKSVCVTKGDRVAKGDIIGTSGTVGFSPEPHLHFAAYRSMDPNAPTVRVHFHGASLNESYLPRAGHRYSTEWVIDS